MADVAALQQKLGVSFKRLSLLEQALLHSSYVNENPAAASGSNERLEFLGDAVLGLVIAEKLYQDFPGLAEGEMTKMRSAVVSREALAQAAGEISLGDFLRLGKGEESSGGRQKPANLAGALEALIAAVYLDRGMAAARDFILMLLGEALLVAARKGRVTDYKSRLQELLQSRRQVAPVYRLLEATGPGHDRQFTVEVSAGEDVLASGSGKSKKLAENEAARLALERLSAIFTE